MSAELLRSAWQCLLQRSVVVETGSGCVSIPRRQKVLVGFFTCSDNGFISQVWNQHLSFPRRALNGRRFISKGRCLKEAPYLWTEDFLSRPLEAAPRKTPRVSRFKSLSQCFLMVGIYIPKCFLVPRWVGDNLGSPLWASPLFTKFYGLFC